MTRPTSSESQPLTSTQPLQQGEMMSDSTYMAAPAPTAYPPQMYYTDPYASYQHFAPGHMITPYAGHQAAHGRVAMPIHAGMHRSPEEYDLAHFLPEDEAAPYLHVPAEMSAYSHPIPPNEQVAVDQQLQRSNSMPLMTGFAPQRPNRPQRPRLQTSQSVIAQPRPAIQTQIQRPGMTRHASLRASSRSGSPFVAGDVFDHVSEHEESSVFQSVPAQDSAWDLSAFDTNYGNGQGISPARALGPAPNHPQRFSPGGPNEDLMITPQTNKIAYSDRVPSSAASTARSTSSNYSSVPRKRSSFDSSDDENDGQGHRPLPLRTIKTRTVENKSPPPPPLALSKIPAKSAAVRTSAKLTKVAEDPGVEGVPPGPRSLERPGPSFACIIGQAILSCKAGGLSLEHIYRYVETAYPFFKSGDNAWRNSVRHNLSIHKMFETVPRTEKFPPGKGGIWIIHDDEKCHWPAPDKFIKNFPPGHPHHEVCRQTLHERQKEKEAMEKAAREGKIYVPKKGKKRRKVLMKEEAEVLSVVKQAAKSVLTQAQSDLQKKPKEKSSESIQEPSEDEMFVSLEEMEYHEPTSEESVNKENDMWAIPPPLSDLKGKRKQMEADESLFLTSKRVRLAEPLAPINSFPQEAVAGRIETLDASFITPERERPIPNGKHVLSSTGDFKTPALVQTSSSPGSPPMPSTVARSTHHPSALQQAWTHDDMSETPHRDSSPARPMLDAAFDFKPKPLRTRPIPQEDDFLPTPTITSPPHRGPPKTPVTRSSAAADRNQTPKLHRKTPNMTTVTPVVFRGSPGLPPPTASALLSTPMWEIGGCLDRLKDHFGSPTNTHHIRSPAPPTSPTRYAMMLLEGGSPRKGRSLS
ncbi:uncharacterized protein L203_104484 [Cryptococcus depauperatus CBS 7841]|uniref:Uncharacterized protein n=1 Tax=Cryptococcus depauperatus CBS 7841 TaxID=1295531 RepID=A0A1E3IGB0_9TREE|nr:hepatocyte nuclear factor [Cryptococcus depauperatus CBS 7841]